MKHITNVKYIYWLSQEEKAGLGAELEAKGIRLKHAKGVTCTPLDVLTRIASVAPEVWLDHYPRAGAWYQASEKNGQFLIVSSFELQGYEGRLTALIRPFDFQPPRKAGPQEIEKLVEYQEFLQQMPPQWSQASDNKKKITCAGLINWARK